MSAESVEITLQARGQRYGSYDLVARTAQLIKRTLRRGPTWEALSDMQQESIELIATKLARIVQGDPDYADSWRDLAGYAQLVVGELERGAPAVVTGDAEDDAG